MTCSRFYFLPFPIIHGSPSPRCLTQTYTQSQIGCCVDRRKSVNGGAKGLGFGDSGSEKSTLAIELENASMDRKVHSIVLDGDNLRSTLNKDLVLGRRQEKT